MTPNTEYNPLLDSFVLQNLQHDVFRMLLYITTAHFFLKMCVMSPLSEWCVYVCMCVCVCVCVCVCLCACICVCVCFPGGVCICVCVTLRKKACVQLRVCVCTCVFTALLLETTHTHTLC